MNFSSETCLIIRTC